MGFAVSANIKAICFDIDGTLYPKWKMDLRLLLLALRDLPFSLRYNRYRRQVRREDGVLPLPALSYDEISRRAALAIYKSDDERSVKRFREREERVIRRQFDLLYSHIKPAKNVRAALSKAKEEGFLLGALSDFPLSVKLSAMGLESYFDVSLSSEDIGRYKPSGRPFIVLSESLDVKAENILYVGDSYSKDVIGAHSAGMKTCLIFSRPKAEYNLTDVFATDWNDFIEKVL